MNKEYTWWNEGVIYEVYVRSFMDSNGDGVGDLKGIISRLDYLEWLGVKAIWLTPVYLSPMKDFGYDISDHCKIDPLFGTIEDFDMLLHAVHEKNMKLIMDLVPNHTSDQHPWFIESRSSKNNKKRDWYYWKSVSDDIKLPNNWLSVFGGSAWQWDSKTGQFYYHAFLKEQPDLNLRNEEVVDEILNIMCFWLDKGVDGFRIDSVWHLIKDNHWRNNPINPDFNDQMPDSAKVIPVFSCDQPGVHDLIRKMRALMDKYKHKVLIGELYLPENKIVEYYGKENKGVDLPANFHFLFVDWNARDIAIMVDKYEAAIPRNCWPHWVFGNHDRPRLVSRIGQKQIRNAALLLFTLRGTPTIYYGDEIGMSQAHIPQDELKDPQGLNMPEKNLSRDPQRTPMQWNGNKGAGFTEGHPWLPFADNWKEINVEQEMISEDSILHLYKRLIALRHSEQSLKTGNYFPIITDNEAIFAFVRSEENCDNFLVAVNFSDHPQDFQLVYEKLEGKIELSTLSLDKGRETENHFMLEGNAGVIIRLSAQSSHNFI